MSDDKFCHGVYDNNKLGTPDTSGCDTFQKDNCTPFKLNNNKKDSRFIGSVMNESLSIGGAKFNVYKLLGVKETGKLIDIMGNGTPLSSGDSPGYPIENAFDVYQSEWHSLQRGANVKKSAYAGYDFGEIKTSDGSRNAYGIDTSVRKNISVIGIKQSSDEKKRATKIRIERSADDEKWYGVAVLDIPNDDCFNIMMFNDSVPMRYWRIRPIEFNGTESDYWGIQAIQLYDNYVSTGIGNIQDKVFLENRDRDYLKEPIEISGSYDITDVSTELSKFMIELTNNTMYATVSFSECVSKLGRPIIIGDIIELPSEAQYSATLDKIEKWMEVTDVSWASDGFAPTWSPNLLRIVMQPAYASQETQDIFGDLTEFQIEDGLGLVGNGDGKSKKFQDYSDISKNIIEVSKIDVPESGADVSNTIRQWTDEEIQKAKDHGIDNLQKLGQTPNSLYVEDAMPPNNKPYTEGDTYPSSPLNGDYHRLTYSGLSKDVPARLYRYSSAKGRWVYLETDMRYEFNDFKPRLNDLLKSKNKKSNTSITKDKK